MHDVVVIGAGPAGLMGARLLAEAGRDVVVLEEHAAVGSPVHCTGVLGADAFDELDLPRSTIHTIAGTARFIAPDGTSILLETDTIQAAVVERAAFDAALESDACAAGAAIRTGARVRSVDTAARRAGVTLDDGTRVEARAVVLACGANYRFNRQLGLGVPRTFVQSAQLEVPFPPTDAVELYLGRTTAPGGFAWAVPFQRRGVSYARLGLMCESTAAERFRRFVDTAAARHGAETIALRPRLKILPLAPVDRTYGTRLLAVGDAAGLVKPTTGGGIYYSLLSGRLAAEVLDENLREDNLSARRLKAYETRWRQRLGPEIRAGMAFRTLAARLDDRSIDDLVELARVDGVVPLLKRTADFNWHRGAALALLRYPAFRRIVLESFWR